MIQPKEEPSPSQAPITIVELVLESHRLVGEIHHPGMPRRLLDVLDSTDGGTLAIRNVAIKAHNHADDQERHFDLIHVKRHAILFAVPRVEPVTQASPVEVVAKVFVPVLIMLPSFEITGNVHLLPDVDPAQASMLASNRFIALTEATVATSHLHTHIGEAPVVLVNMGRAQLCAPGPR